jgi:signal transduction histidine kinase
VKKHAILIVDDEQENINLLSNILGDEYTLHQSLDAAGALSLLRKNEIHLILTDQRMPGLTGVELLEKAREARPDCVRMLITAYPDVNNAIQAINRGHVHRYIAKPFDSAELKLAIQQELEHLDLVRSNRRLNEEMGRMVDELFRANRELRELNQMKDQFLANCSHELKTPLVSGMGYVDLLLSGGMGHLDPRQEKGLKIAHRNLERLLGLIENLLALAKARFRPEELRIARFDLRPLFVECVESLRARARKKSLRVKTTLPRGRVWIDGDERKIHSVITNVLANAEKFTPDEARIEIRVFGAKDGKVRVTVTDNGVGIPEEKAEIQPFRTTTDLRYAGMGIGLTLARQILQAHQCDISLERGPRGGARVHFDLPTSDGRPPAPKPRRAAP